MFKKIKTQWQEDKEEWERLDYFQKMILNRLQSRSEFSFLLGISFGVLITIIAG